MPATIAAALSSYAWSLSTLARTIGSLREDWRKGARDKNLLVATRRASRKARRYALPAAPGANPTRSIYMKEICKRTRP
jgi:hypothetical protein